MTGHGQGKYQQLIAEMQAAPGAKFYIGDEVNYTAIKRLKDLGAVVDYVISRPRSETGLSRDLYSAAAYWPTPETTIERSQLALATLRRELTEVRTAQIADEERLTQLKKETATLQRRLRAADKRVLSLLEEIDYEQSHINYATRTAREELGKRDSDAALKARRSLNI